MKPGDLIQSRYVLRDLLGQGGMAEVWRTHDRHLGRDVALKIIAPQLSENPEWLVRFFAEAQAAAGISHPGVTTILDFGQHDDRPYLVMEYVSGGSLAAVAGREPMELEAALRLVADVAEGAGAAHSLGIVHRDIKPANILLTEEGRAKLADFGISASLGAERLTVTGAAIGSPHYVSPEQVSSAPVTPASDVYSLGVVLFELVTGSRPFYGRTPAAVAFARLDRDAPPPSTRRPGLEPFVDEVVLRCLQRHPQARFADGSVLGRALRAALAGTPSALPGDGGRAPASAAPAQPNDALDDTQDLGVPRMRPRPRALLAAGVLVVLSAGATLIAAGSGSSGTSGAHSFPPLERRDRPDSTTMRPPPRRAAAQTNSSVPIAATPASRRAAAGRRDEARVTEGATDAPTEQEVASPTPSPSEDVTPTPSVTPSPTPTDTFDEE